MNEEEVKIDKHRIEANPQLIRLKQEKSIFENGKPYFTYLLLLVQIFLFLFMEIKGGGSNSATLIRFGAKVNPLMIQGEWWRFFTPVFLHIGYLHIIMNSIALFFVGTLVERIFGNVRFLLIFLFAGFTGTLASFVFSSSISAGASGAIFGCLGALLFFGIVYPKLFFRTIGINVLIVVVLDLGFGFIVSGIDNAGHIGGLIGGFLVTGALYFPKRKKYLWQSINLLLCTAFTIGFLIIGFSDLTKNLNTHASYALAQTYVEDEEFDQAYSVLKDVQSSGVKSADLFYMLSIVELKKGMQNQAKQHLYQVINMDWQYHEAYYYLGLIYMNNYDFEKALEYAEKALKLKPSQEEYKKLVEKINDYKVDL